MTQASALYDELRQGLEQNHLQLSELLITQLVEYLLLLNQWNRVYNLTSISKPQQMLLKHILDSLSVGPYLQGTRILDVGSGAGLPGIPLALTQPHRHFTLIDSNGKKSRFLTHVLQQLKLINVEIIQDRVERFHTTLCFDSIVSRAFSSLNVFLQRTGHLVCTNGIFIAMKGRYPTQEIQQLDPSCRILSVHAIEIHGLAEERYIVVLAQAPSPFAQNDHF